MKMKFVIFITIYGYLIEKKKKNKLKDIFQFMNIYVQVKGMNQFYCFD